MDIFVAVLLFLVGLALIVKGSDFFVDAATWLSDVTGISRAIIGATIVSFATTSPEFFVSILAIVKGANELSVGNAVGSLLCNIGLAFALICIAQPGKVEDSDYGKKGLIMLGATAVLFVLCLNGVLSVLDGVLMLGIFLFFTGYNIWDGKKKEAPQQKHPTTKREIIINVLKFVGGGAAVIFGADLLVDNGQIIARALGISEAIIGLTFIAIGTSLPELATSIAALVKKEKALSLGNIIGANTIDATLILATSAFVAKDGLVVSAPTISGDLPVTLVLMAVAVLPILLKKKVYRWQGIALAAIYLTFIVWRTISG